MMRGIRFLLTSLARIRVKIPIFSAFRLPRPISCICGECTIDLSVARPAPTTIDSKRQWGHIRGHMKSFFLWIKFSDFQKKIKLKMNIHNKIKCSTYCNPLNYLDTKDLDLTEFEPIPGSLTPVRNKFKKHINTMKLLRNANTSNVS